MSLSYPSVILRVPPLVPFPHRQPPEHHAVLHPLLHLLCVGHHPLLPSLRPGQTLCVTRRDAKLVLCVDLNPIILGNVLAAIRDGALTSTGEPMASEDLVTDLRALLTPAAERAAG